MRNPRIFRAAVATVVGAALALSAAPAANAAQHTGCYYPLNDRKLRIVPKAQSCKPGERRISWSSRATSAKGERGARGPRGLQGVRGEAGAPGPQGPQGAPGPQGIPGTAGAKGDTGAAGAIGPTGAAGAAGPAGTAGAPGATGGVGPAGPTGPSGPTGAAGAVGPAGPDGATGPAGAAGPAGPEGPEGPTGPAGAAGSAGPAGTIGPAGVDGIGTIFSSSSAGPTAMTSIVGGLVGTAAMLPPNGYGAVTSPTVLGGSLNLVGSSDPGQPIARDGTITAVSGHLSLTVALSLVGSTVTPFVQVWKADQGSNTYFPVAETYTSLSPLTGVLSIGTTASGQTTGLAVPVLAGERLLVVTGVTATGLTLVNTVVGNVSTSVAVS